jgi:hypothetical protein
MDINGAAPSSDFSAQKVACLKHILYTAVCLPSSFPDAAVLFLIAMICFRRPRQTMFQYPILTPSQSHCSTEIEI